jgi:hypothetical protein
MDKAGSKICDFMGNPDGSFNTVTDLDRIWRRGFQESPVGKYKACIDNWIVTMRMDQICIEFLKGGDISDGKIVIRKISEVCPFIELNRSEIRKSFSQLFPRAVFQCRS